jgi:hypothetical protein
MQAGSGRDSIASYRHDKFCSRLRVGWRVEPWCLGFAESVCHGFTQHRLARRCVAHDGEIAYVCGLILFHKNNGVVEMDKDKATARFLSPAFR